MKRRKIITYMYEQQPVAAIPKKYLSLLIVYYLDHYNTVQYGAVSWSVSSFFSFPAAVCKGGVVNISRYSAVLKTTVQNSGD